MPLIEWISYVLTLSGLFLLIGFVAARNYKSPINQKFVYFTATIIGYVGCAFMSEVARPLSSALFWTRFALFWSTFTPLTFFMFTLTFTGWRLRRAWVKPFVYVMPFVIAPLAFLPAAITTVKYDTYGTSIDKTGPFLIFMMILLLIGFSISFRILHYKANQSTGSDRSQLKLIIYGVGTAVFVNVFTQVVLTEMGITSYGDLLGTPSNVVLVGAVGYAIIRHGLFYIKAAILRSLTYILGIITVIFFYGLAIFFITTVVVKDFVLPISLALYFIVSSIVLALSFPITLRIYQKLTDRLFYRDRYDPQELLNTLSRQLAGTIILERLSDQVLKTIATNMRIDRADLIVLDEGRVYFSSKNISQDEIAQLYPNFSNFEDKISIIDMIEAGRRRKLLSQLQITALVRLETNQKTVGYLLLGDKLSGYIYSATDVSMLDTISTELAVAIANALAYSQISHFNETLKLRIAQATKELSVANVKLHQLDDAKDDFISMASHQLRTPISAISGYITLLLDKIYANDPVRYDLTLKKALHISENMGELVNDLLNVSRMDTGRFYLDKRPIDLNEIVKFEIEQLQIHAHRSKTKLVFVPPPRPVPVIMADEEKVRQAVMNLITNALIYAPNGQVEVELDLIGNSIVYKVTDDGIGVPEGEKSKLFSRFFRAENAQKVRPDGTGLGLYLVKRVVDDHGGSIIFSSQEGKGSTFGFSLPLHSKVLTKRAPKTSTPPAELTSRLT